MSQKFANGAKMKLATSCLATDTSIQITAATADRFPVCNTSDWNSPANWCRATIQDNTGAFEIVQVGVRASGSATLSNLRRAQEGTTALPWSAGSLIQLTPTAADFQNILAGIFGQLTISNGTQAAAFALVGGLLTFCQASPDGTLGASRFTFDQTTGLLTVTDIAMTSDERTKTGWRKLPANFLQRLADVKRGIFRRKDTGRLEVGVSAQSLRELLPWAVKHNPADGLLSVNYGQAALVSAIELAADNAMLRAELADVAARLKKLERRA